MMKRRLLLNLSLVLGCKEEKDGIFVTLAVGVGIFLLGVVG